jgi:hypothetical protein
MASNHPFVSLVVGILIGLTISHFTHFILVNHPLQLTSHFNEVVDNKNHPGLAVIIPQDTNGVDELKDSDNKRNVMPLVDVFPNEMYRTKSTPQVQTGGSVYLGPNNWLSIGGNECFFAFCKTPPDVSEQKFMQIEGDVIAVYISHHYFHFVYESMLQMHALLLHGVFERHPNATILCYGDGVPKDVNFEMMKALKFVDLSRFKIMKAQKRTVYKVDLESTLIVTRNNNYHYEKIEGGGYNFWLLDSMRLRLDIPEAPSDSLFLSRKGYRRGVEREDELFEALQVSNPSLRRIFPDDFTVAQQAELFAHAKLIVAPHGASLTNVIFSNWNELVLIELSPIRNSEYNTFRRHLQVKRHYLLQCQSVPCKAANPEGDQCDVWERQIDVNVAQVMQVVNSILSGVHPDREDFVVRRHADL